MKKEEIADREHFDRNHDGWWPVTIMIPQPTKYPEGLGFQVCSISCPLWKRDGAERSCILGWSRTVEHYEVPSKGCPHYKGEKL